MDLTGSCQSLPGACLKNHFRVLCSPHCAPQGISCPSGNIRVQIAGMIFKTRSGLPAAVFVISSKNFSYFNITHSITSIPRIILNLLYSWSPEKLRYNIYGSARYSACGSLPPDSISHSGAGRSARRVYDIELSLLINTKPDPGSHIAGSYPISPHTIPQMILSENSPSSCDIL